MKDLASKIFKFIGASIGLLVAAYTIGWSGAMALHTLFKEERAEATTFVREQVAESEQRVMNFHNADVAGLHGKVDILIDQNKIIISQNYQTRKAIEANK